jgi:SAM-dependent methyltransferase
MDDSAAKLNRVRRMWDESAKASSRVLAVHFTEDGRPVDESVYDEIFEEMDRLVRFTLTDRVLEVGAGSGLLLERIVARVSQAVGTDLSAEILKRVPRRSNLAIRQMDTDQLEFENESFDKVICQSVIQYFPDLDYAHRCVEEMVRVCRKDGKIFIGDVFNSYLRDFCIRQSVAQSGWFQRAVSEWRRWRGEPSIYPYLFIDPYVIRSWSTELGCRGFAATLQLGRKKPILHRMFRYDIVITK